MRTSADTPALLGRRGYFPITRRTQHPKVVRQNLRLAFLSPQAPSAILKGSQPTELSLARIPKLLLMPWIDQQQFPN
jgi:hypothetical protein